MNKIKISIGTAAFNEEANIKKMLQSVLMQEESNFKIQEVLVLSDGSTDKTAKIAKEIKDKRVKVFDDKTRKGQAIRIQQILDEFRGDILVLLDSDMILKDKNALSNLIKKFNKNIGLVAGKMVPLPAKTLLEDAINNYRLARFDLEKEFSFGKSAFGTNAFFAIRKDLAKSIKIPKDNLNHDSFCYFSAIKNNMKTAYAEKAVALYRSPQSTKDLIGQSTRHLAGGLQLKKFFGPEIVSRGFYVPRRILIKLMLYQLIKNPIGYIYLKCLNIYCHYKSQRIIRKKINVRWASVATAKVLLTASEIAH